MDEIRQAHHISFVSVNISFRLGTDAIRSAGGMPFVARDLMQFPLSTPSDGSIDLVIQTVVSYHPLTQDPSHRFTGQS